MNFAMKALFLLGLDPELIIQSNMQAELTRLLGTTVGKIEVSETIPLSALQAKAQQVYIFAYVVSYEQVKLYNGLFLRKMQTLLPGTEILIHLFAADDIQRVANSVELTPENIRLTILPFLK